MLIESVGFMQVVYLESIAHIFEISHTYGQLPAHFSSNFDLLPIRYKPKELASSMDVNALTSNPIHSLDAWCLGCVICETFNGRFDRPQQLSKLGKIPKELQAHYKRLLATKVELLQLQLQLQMMSCYLKYRYN